MAHTFNQKKAPEANLFLRKATGLVRSWSVLDAFIYAIFSINLITLGLYIFSQMYFLQGGLLPTLIGSALFIIFEVVVYASLVAVMPRSGGDYVWQSRILGGGIGFVLAVTGWWFILWLWVPLYSDMLRHIFLTPLLGILGAKSAALWFGQTSLGLFISCVLVCLVAALYIALGMKWYARVQRICFFVGLAGLLIVFGFLLFGSSQAFQTGLGREAPALFGASSDVYGATLAAGEAAGAVAPLTGGGIGAIFLAMPFIVFFNLWPNWGTTLYGEVRGASDFKRNFFGMAGALVITTVLGIIFFLLINKTLTWDFYMKANGAWWNYAWGYTSETPPLPVWPYPALLAVFMTSSRVVQFIVVLMMSLWWFGWSGTVFLSSTRVIFAAAFDRLLPEKVADVDPKTRTPIWALLLMVIPSLIVSALFAWDLFSFRSLTLDSTLVIAVTYLGTTIAAILLPYRKPDLYNASPIAKYKVLGIPLITAAGIVFGGFLVFLLYEWLIDPNQLYGIGLSNSSSIIFILVLYVLAFGIYTGFKRYRKSTGIDIDRVHQEIPVE
ncbi:MAG: APC family permease [Anaerolineaceae bacterium]|nr:APC family permease [Anaerolineaceae bacterium]